MIAALGKLVVAAMLAGTIAGGSGPTIEEQVTDKAVRKSLVDYAKLKSAGSLGGIELTLTAKITDEQTKLIVHGKNTGGKPAVEKIKIVYALCGAKFEKGRWVTTCTKGGAKSVAGPAPGQEFRKTIKIPKATEFNKFAYQVPNVTISLSGAPEKKLKLAALKLQKANLP